MRFRETWRERSEQLLEGAGVSGGPWRLWEKQRERSQVHTGVGRLTVQAVGRESCSLPRPVSSLQVTVAAVTSVGSSNGNAVPPSPCPRHHCRPKAEKLSRWRLVQAQQAHLSRSASQGPEETKPGQ